MEAEDLAKVTLVSGPEAWGRRVYFAVTRISLEADRYESAIWLYEHGRGRPRPVLTGPFDVAAKPHGDRLAFLRRHGGEGRAEGRTEGRREGPSRAVGLWLWDGEARELARFPLGVLDFEWAPDGERLLVVAYEGRVEDDVKRAEGLPLWLNDFGYAYAVSSHLYVVDAWSGRRRRVTEGDVRVLHASWGPDGKIAYTVARDRLRPYLVDVVVYDGREHRTLASGFTANYHLAWSPDGKAVAFLGHRRPRGLSSHNRVWVAHLDGEVECVTCGFDRNAVNGVLSDVRGPSFSKAVQWGRDGIYFIATVGGSTGLYRAVDGGVEAVVAPGEGVVDEFALMDGGVAYTYMDPVTPKELYVAVDGESTRVTSFNAGLAEELGLLRPRRFSFKASDGAEVEGWALIPPGEGKRRWVLYIHGGPKMAFGWSFMFEFQFLASRGIAVVYTNPRGSDGYSEEFADIRCRYGERDFQDLMEAVDHALGAFPELDPERVGVAGGSYGGFMTNWIITHTDRFKAAVTQRSICDWVSMYLTTDIGWYFVEDQLCCTPWKDRERCIEKSPLYMAHRVRTPTLVIHSTEDYRTWLDQGVMFYTALKLAGVEARLTVFPGESHELTRSGRPRHRVENLREIAGWLERYLK